MDFCCEVVDESHLIEVSGAWLVDTLERFVPSVFYHLTYLCFQFTYRIDHEIQDTLQRCSVSSSEKSQTSQHPPEKSKNIKESSLQGNSSVVPVLPLQAETASTMSN